MQKKHHRSERRIHFLRKLKQLKVEIAHCEELTEFACPCCELEELDEQIEQLECELAELLGKPFHARLCGL